MKASEIRVRDALVDILDEVTAALAGHISEQRMQERIQLHLELMASRLLTDAALLVNRNFPALNQPEPSRGGLVSMVQEL